MIAIPGNMKMYWEVLIIPRMRFMIPLKKKAMMAKVMVAVLVADFNVDVALSNYFTKPSLGIYLGTDAHTYQKSSSNALFDFLDLISFGLRKSMII